MDFKSIPLFSEMKKRLSWLDQRQEVLASNIANADTPGYRPSDLKPLDFEDMVQQQVKPVQLASTNPGHMAGTVPHNGVGEEEKVRKPYETAPDGNAVDLEEQMMKVSETQANHSLVTQLYKKHMQMIRTAIGSR